MKTANQYDFEAVGRIPTSEDNVAIATQRIEFGSENCPIRAAALLPPTRSWKAIDSP